MGSDEGQQDSERSMGIDLKCGGTGGGDDGVAGKGRS